MSYLLNIHYCNKLSRVAFTWCESNFLVRYFFCFLKHLKGSFRRLEMLICQRHTHRWCRKIKITSNFIPMGKNLFKIITEGIIITSCSCWKLAIKKWELSQQISFWNLSVSFEQIEEALQRVKCYVWTGLCCQRYF